MTVPKIIRSYAEGIVTDTRWAEFVKLIDQDQFQRWQSAMDKMDMAELERVRQEYIGFKVFSSKLKVLATQITLGDQKK